jgi:hypothetical protein
MPEMSMPMTNAKVVLPDLENSLLVGTKMVRTP